MVRLKRLFLLLFFVLSTLVIYAQKEGAIWYFGVNAGLDFNSGTPVALTNGKMNTFEGCATISDKDGNLLFYTDGISVWDKKHQLMETGLLGNSSSSQSAIIVPHPGDINKYYIFTVAANYHTTADEGLNYSLVDLNLNAGDGDIVSNEKNIELLSITEEKITAVKKSETEYWVLARYYDSFYSYNIDTNGMNTVPVVTKIAPALLGAVNNFYGINSSIGYMKFSPDGTKLAVAFQDSLYPFKDYVDNVGGIYLYDFDIVTGRPSNPRLLSEFFRPYGVEFSPDSSKLYITTGFAQPFLNLINGNIYQFNLTATDIPNSKVNILSLPDFYFTSSIQLGIDGKIYFTTLKDSKDFFDDGIWSEYMSVLENPNANASDLNFNLDKIYLGGKHGRYGLPTFISSFFKVGIAYKKTCFNSATEFNLISSKTISSISWNFGDPVSGANNISLNLEPTHEFSAPGTYEVSVTVTDGVDTATETTSVTIHELPVFPKVLDLKQCDNDLDGFTAFNLNEVIPNLILNSKNETVTFYESVLDAENKIKPILNTMVYTNQIASVDTIWARVENSNGCYMTCQINLIVTTTQIPSTFAKYFYVCDDDKDGVSSFNFSSVHTEIESIFPVGQQLDIVYYRNEADALAEINPIKDISNYRNIGYPNSQQIYVRVESKLDNSCLALGANINLYVESQPIANPVTIQRQCDDNQDGLFPFDVSQIETMLLNGQSLNDLTVTYFDENNNQLPSPLPNPFLTPSQIITMRVTNDNVSDGSCYDETILEFIIDNQPIANIVAKQLSCDDGIDDTDGFHEFDTSLIENIVLNGQTGMEVYYYDELGTKLSSPLPNPFNSNSQIINVEVVNPINTSCTATTELEFVVNPLPVFSIETPHIVCSSDPTFTVVLDPIESNALENYDFKWVYEDGTTLSNMSTLTVSTPGTYSITLTKIDGTGCFRTRNIFVNASEIATITLPDISIIDVSNNNTITIKTNNLGQGDYEFALDDEFSFYQDNPVFENVSSGIHELFVRDKKGCGTSSISISIIGFPKFFTPNGDGYNDTWQVSGVSSRFQKDSDIFIYNRYGKLLKQLSTTSKGWDGTSNGKELPNDDYWFSVSLEDGREFKGHFALKR